MKLMRIQSWAVKTFDRPPCEKTLYRWAREKLIWPPPRKQGMGRGSECQEVRQG